ncbi:hypothetical protein Hdeb2414_s0162g00818861 [Helianthus debilis subsp. tardiflorus]
MEEVEVSNSLTTPVAKNITIDEIKVEMKWMRSEEIMKILKNCSQLTIIGGHVSRNRGGRPVLKKSNKNKSLLLRVENFSLKDYKT